MTLPGDNWTSYYLPLVSNLTPASWNTYPPILGTCPMGKLITANTPMAKLVTGGTPI